MSDVRQQIGRDRRVRGLTWRRDVALPAVVAVVQLGATAAIAASPHGGDVTALDWASLILGPLALLARRQLPVTVLWVTFALTLVGTQPRFVYLSLIVAFFVAAVTGHRRAAWSAIVVGYASATWLAPLAQGRSVASLSFASALGAWLAVLVIAAEVIRMRRERAVDAAAARALDVRRRASEERLQMAREIHDVVGHNISLMNIQASVGLDLMDADPRQARDALAAIKLVSKEALEELRTMLAAIRNEDESAPRAPVPGLDRLAELTQLSTTAGLTVSTEYVGEPRPVPAAVDLAAYRIVQESLTNAARHAAPAAVTVRLTYADQELTIEIDDDGRRLTPNGHPGPGTRGSGIAGMRERATALGGCLDADPRPAGGFGVKARLPLHSAP